MRALALALLLATGVAGAAQNNKTPEPRYVVEPCCDLCSRASNPAVYNTKFLESFTTLTKGREGWLFRSDDLRTTFGIAVDF